jgi:cholesterol oxidase
MSHAPARSLAHFDVAVIGSGFGGSVMAMRLSQKGYRVVVLEMGKRYRPGDFPRSNWNLRKYLWAPRIRCFGFQKISLLRGLMVLHGVGVGGGSLVYAATLPKPSREVLGGNSWPTGHDWASLLEPHFETARRMLGVARNPRLAPADLALRRVGARLGVEETFAPVEAGVHFGEAAEMPDPYFGGEGPARSGCTHCGGCLVGCRQGAKNSLDLNYLHLAEKLGALVVPETRADRITPLGESPGYRIETRMSTAWLPRANGTFTADRVVVSAGVLGTLELLLRNKYRYRTLTRISDRLGETVRTNGESLVGATRLQGGVDYSQGLAIGSAIRPSGELKIEAVRYPSGSDLMRLLGVPLTPEGNLITRPLKLLGQIVRRFHRIVRLAFARDWAKGSVILLVMQSIDQKLRIGLKGRSLSVRHRAGGSGVPSFIPEAQRAAVLLAEEIQGEPQNVLPEVLFRAPTTAHILGGCCMAGDAHGGVVSSMGEVFGHPGLFVADGSVVPTNLGVNPSLTITALAEHFASQWPEKGGAASPVPAAPR